MQKKLFIATALFIVGLIFLIGLVISLQKEQVVPEENIVELLPEPIILSGAKTIASTSIPFSAMVLKDQDTLRIAYNTHGLCLLPADASALSLVQQEKTFSISLSSYGKHCYAGEQVLDIPLSQFEGFDRALPTDALQITIWAPTEFSLAIESILAYQGGGRVLGVESEPKSPDRNKTFSHITPIRDVPYAPFAGDTGETTTLTTEDTDQ